MMELPTYEAKGKAETGWVGVGIAIGTLVSTILIAVGVDGEAAVGIGGAVGILARSIIGAFVLPG